MKIIDSMRFKVHKGKEKVKTFFEHHKTEFKYAAVATVIGAKYIIAAYRVSNLQSEKVNLEKDCNNKDNIISTQQSKIDVLNKQNLELKEEKEQMNKQIREVAADGLRNGSSVSGKVMNGFRTSETTSRLYS